MKVLLRSERVPWQTCIPVLLSNLLAMSIHIFVSYDVLTENVDVITVHLRDIIRSAYILLSYIAFQVTESRCSTLGDWKSIFREARSSLLKFLLSLKLRVELV